MHASVAAAGVARVWGVLLLVRPHLRLPAVGLI
jgi:hypothetical protein